MSTFVRRVRRSKDFRTARGPTQPGRNDPCPCGSGRKFKSCHRTEPHTSLAAKQDGERRRVRLAFDESDPNVSIAKGYAMTTPGKPEELRLSITHVGDAVALTFAVPVTSILMSPDQAEDLARKIGVHAAAAAATDSVQPIAGAA